MATLEDRTGLGWRLLFFVPLSTLATVAVLAAMVAAGAGPGPGAFTLVFGTVGAFLYWPLTLPGAILAWVLVWHTGWRLGLPETIWALPAACAAALGGVAGLAAFLMWHQDSAARLVPDMRLIAMAAIAGGIAAASLLYLRPHRREGGTA